MLRNLKKINAADYPADTLPIFIASDENYANYVVVLMQSIMDNASNNNHYLIAILDCGLDDNAKESIKQQSSKFINCSVAFIDLSTIFEQNRTEQNRTEQNRTEQNRTPLRNQSFMKQDTSPRQCMADYLFLSSVKVLNKPFI